MSTEDANDVTKALAAFGAPSIRYHRFSQTQVKPSNVVIPRREPLTPLPVPIVAPAPLSAQPPVLTPVTSSAAEPLLRQNEPDAAPEPYLAGAARMASFAVPAAVPRPIMPMPPMPAFRRTMDPAVPAFRARPVPPPRALDEHPAEPPISNQIPPAAQPVAPPYGVVLNAADGAAPNPAAGFRPMPPPLPPVAMLAEALGSNLPPNVPGHPARGGTLTNIPMADQPHAGRGQAKVRNLREIFAFIAAGPQSSTPPLRTFG